MLTNLNAAKQAPAIYLTLEGKAREAILQLDITTLNTDQGVKVITDKLDELFLPNKELSAYAAYDKFEKYSRSPQMNINDYVIEFERLYAKCKSFDLVLPDGILAYRFLESANVSNQHKEIVRATLDNLTYAEMKKQLKKVLLDPSKTQSLSGSHSSYSSPSSSSPAVKVEPEVEDVYYGYNTRGYYNGNRRKTYSNNNRSNYRNSGGIRKKDDDRCFKCGSIFHWANTCPDASRNAKPKETKFNLLADIVDIPDTIDVLVGTNPRGDIKELLGECLGMAILDSGCSKTVCGETWFNCYLDTLSKKERDSINFGQSKTVFKFGDGELVPSIKIVKIPANISGYEVSIETDIINNMIPLLLSKEAMKKADTQIDFKTDSVTMLGKKQQVVYSSTGHYCIPISFTNTSDKVDCKINLICKGIDGKSLKEKENTALKLHRQFSHAKSCKIIDLLKNAGINDKDINQMLEKLDNSCSICLKYRKVKSRPVVGLPLAKDFNETVGMDLKEWSSNPKIWFLHLVDHATRYGVEHVLYEIRDRKQLLIKFLKLGSLTLDLHNQYSLIMVGNLIIIISVVCAKK